MTRPFFYPFWNVLFQDIYFLSSRYEAEYMKNRKKGPPEDKTPKFEFYLYNDAGRIIKQYLSIHEIQQILLQQSQNLGRSLSNLLSIHQIFFQDSSSLPGLSGETSQIGDRQSSQEEPCPHRQQHPRHL